MKEELTVFLVDSLSSSLQAQKAVVDEIEGLSLIGEAQNLTEGYEMIRHLRPNIIVMEIASPHEESLSLIEKILLALPHSIIVAMADGKDAELILRVIRAGAMEYLERPVRAQELASALKRVLQTSIKKKATEAPFNEGSLLTVFSNKGGMGATTIAVNLGVFLAEITQGSTALIDVNLSGSDVAMMLDMQPEHTLFDVTKNISRVDAVFMQKALIRHSSGLYVLAGPYESEAADFVTAEQINQALRTLKGMFRYVVVDVPHSFDEITLACMDQSPTIFLVMDLNLPSIRNTRRALDVFRRLHYQEKVKLVVNRYDSYADIKVEAVEETLNFPVYWLIPNDFFNVSSSINQGIPLSQLDANAKISQNFKEMAVFYMTGRRELKEKVEAGDGLLNRFFHWFKAEEKEKEQ